MTKISFQQTKLRVYHLRNFCGLPDLKILQCLVFMDCKTVIKVCSCDIHGSDDTIECILNTPHKLFTVTYITINS